MSGVRQATASQSWEASLEALNQRDGAVEITGLSALRDASGAIDSSKANVRRPQGVAPSFRVRLLACRPAGLVVDRPVSPEEAHYFQQGAVVRVLVVDGPARWELMTTVMSRVKFRLNDQAVVAAIVLSGPHEVSSVQRREFFRVSTAAAKLPPVSLVPVTKPPVMMDQKQNENNDAAEAFGPKPQLLAFAGTLVNVGGGGMGVEAPLVVAFTLSLCMRYQCVVELPSMDKPLEVDCTLVHLEALPGGMHYLGLRFEAASAAARHRVEDQICHFTSWLERQQLQRMHRKR